MVKVNVHEAKARLAHLLDEVEKGKTIIICRRNVPVAELRPVRQLPKRPRPFGLDRGTFHAPDDFNEPLPRAEVEAWEPK